MSVLEPEMKILSGILTAFILEEDMPPKMKQWMYTNSGQMLNLAVEYFMTTFREEKLLDVLINYPDQENVTFIVPWGDDHSESWQGLFHKRLRYTMKRNSAAVTLSTCKKMMGTPYAHYYTFCK